MNLEKIKNFKFEKKDFDFKKIKDSFWDFALDKFGIISMLIFLIAFVFSGFLIYKNLYSSGWSDAQKMEYRTKAEENKAGFNLDNFKKVIGKIEERASARDKSFEISRDVFGATKD